MTATFENKNVRKFNQSREEAEIAEKSLQHHTLNVNQVTG